MSYGEFMAEEQKARMQAIKDSEFRAANDDGEPATDLAGVGPSSLSPPEVVLVTVEDEEFGEDFTVKVTVSDLIAAIREGVESGTIKGEVVEWCEAHGRPASATTCGAFVRDMADEPNYNLVGGVRDCHIVSKLLIPVSDGGSET